MTGAAASPEQDVGRRLGAEAGTAGARLRSIDVVCGAARCSWRSHLIGMTLALAQGGELRTIPVVTDPASLPPWYGVSLPGVYIAWLIVVALMYLPCLWFARVKSARGRGWLRYA